MPDLVTVDDAAAWLGCSTVTVRRMIRDKKLLRVKVGRLDRVQVGDAPACTFRVDGATYKDQRVGDVVATSWGLIEVLDININSKVVTLLHGTETRVLTVGSVLDE